MYRTMKEKIELKKSKIRSNDELNREKDVIEQREKYPSQESVREKIKQSWTKSTYI